jgi:aspartyl/asparaginyl-tRNA synthetase
VIPEKDLKKKTDSEYFEKPVYLTVSGQLHLEAICNGIAQAGNLNLSNLSV